MKKTTYGKRWESKMAAPWLQAKGFEVKLADRYADRLGEDLTLVHSGREIRVDCALTGTAKISRLAGFREEQLVNKFGSHCRTSALFTVGTIRIATDLGMGREALLRLMTQQWVMAVRAVLVKLDGSRERIVDAYMDKLEDRVDLRLIAMKANEWEG
jgi:hypothetical protein